jgi:cytochrome b subunit of formate dehydrogenase
VTAGGQRVKRVKRIVRWSLVLVTVAYVVTGFGITEFRTVESWTFGVLTKPWALRIHNNLEIPFIVLLALHVLLSPGLRAYVRLRRPGTSDVAP